MPRGNLIRRVIAEYDNASIQEIEIKTRINLQAIANACSEETRFNTVFVILHSCIHLAVGRKGKVNKKEEKFINNIFESFLPSTVSIDKSTYEERITKEEMDLLKNIGTELAFGPELGLCVLRIILGYAFSDGVLEDDLAKQLETLFSSCLIADFMKNGEVSDSAEGEVIDGVEAKIVRWLSKGNKVAGSKDLYSQFKSYPRKEVTSALKRLLNKNIVYKVDTYAGEMYALTGEPYRVTRSGRASAKSVSKKAPKQLDDIPFPVIKEIEGTGYYGRAKRFEKIHAGDPLVLKTDWKSRDYSPVAIEVSNSEGETLGYLGENGELPNLETLALLADENLIKASVQTVTPLSKRRKNAKYALMDIMIVRNDTDKPNKEVSSSPKKSGNEKEPELKTRKKSQNIEGNKSVKVKSGDFVQEVVINNELKVYIPEDMEYTTEKLSINGVDRVLSAATSDFDIKKGDLQKGIFKAQRNITMLQMIIPFAIDFSSKESVAAVVDILFGVGAKVAGRKIKEHKYSKSIATYYFESGENTFAFCTALPSRVYTGQYFLKDLGKKEAAKVFKQFLDSLEPFEETEKKTSVRNKRSSDEKKSAASARQSSAVKAGTGKTARKTSEEEKKRKKEYEKLRKKALGFKVAEVKEAVERLNDYRDFEGYDEVLTEARQYLADIREQEETEKREQRKENLSWELDSLKNPVSAESEHTQSEPDRSAAESHKEDVSVTEVQSPENNEIKDEDDAELQKFNDAVSLAENKIKETERRHSEKIHALQERHETNKRKISDLEREKAGLGFFSFGRKKEISQHIEYLTKQNNETADEIKHIENSHTARISELQEDLESAKKKLEEEKKKASVSSKGGSKPSPSATLTANTAEFILGQMTSESYYSFTDIKAMCVVIGIYDEDRINSALKVLMNTGFVEHIGSLYHKKWSV